MVLRRRRGLRGRPPSAPTRPRPRSPAPARGSSRPRSPSRPPAARRGRRSRRRGPRRRASARTPRARSSRSHVAASTSRPCDARRVPSGGGSPRRYLPVSSPRASGKNGIRPIPSRSHSGTRSRSTPRSRSEYRFCAETNRSRPPARATASASAACAPPKLRRADEPHLALGDELAQRAERLLDRRDPVGAVVLVEVDPVGAEAARASPRSRRGRTPREPPTPGPQPNFVAITARSRRPASARPRSSSLRPPP